MEPNDLLNKLGEYASVLNRAFQIDIKIKRDSEATKTEYRNHLTFVAKFFVALYEKKDLQYLEDLIFQEERQFGWGFLPGEHGSEVCHAWVNFMKYFKSFKGDC